MASLAERFEAQVDRTGEHHHWLGATNADRGTGRLKVDGRHVTAHRVHGSWRTGRSRPARVRLDDLRLVGAPAVAAVAQRQGHGPQVLVKHYGKRRESADRKAAEHLGRGVHGGYVVPITRAAR